MIFKLLYFLPSLNLSESLFVYFRHKKSHVSGPTQKYTYLFGKIHTFLRNCQWCSYPQDVVVSFANVLLKRILSERVWMNHFLKRFILLSSSELRHVRVDREWKRNCAVCQSLMNLREQRRRGTDVSEHTAFLFDNEWVNVLPFWHTLSLLYCLAWVICDSPKKEQWVSQPPDLLVSVLPGTCFHWHLFIQANGGC